MQQSLGNLKRLKRSFINVIKDPVDTESMGQSTRKDHQEVALTK